jgi:hypothetical protein
MKVVYCLVLGVFVMGCELLDKYPGEECTDTAGSSIGYISRGYSSFYEKPLDGYSCNALEDREISNYSNQCSSEITFQSEDSVSKNSTQNTVIPGVKEARAIVHNDDFFFVTEGTHLFIYNQLDSSLEKSIDLKMSRNKMILNEGLLYISGFGSSIYSLKVFDINSVQNIFLKKEWSFSSKISFSLKKETLFVKELSYKDIPTDFACEEILYLGEGKGMPLSAFYKIDLSDLEISEQKLFYGDIHQHIDIDNEYLYIASYSDTFILNQKNSSSTQIKGIIPGVFGLKEKDDHLLLFTEKSSSNNLTILNHNLEYTYTLNGIAPGESIYSVKFEEDRAYLVTFKTVDPLFSFDISDVTAPKLIAELKVPGFSRYMEVMTDERLITFGKETGDWYSEVELNLYDTKTDLKKISSLVLSGIDNLSVFWDHHNIEFHRDFLFLKNYNKVIIIKIENEKLLHFDTIRLQSYYGNAQIMGYLNELRVFENGIITRYDLFNNLSGVYE